MAGRRCSGGCRRVSTSRPQRGRIALGGGRAGSAGPPPAAEALPRLALVYANTPVSLRGTAAWAAAAGVADVSDIALLGRLRNAGPWLEAVPGAPPTARVGPPAGSRAVGLVDATALAAPGGGPGSAWRAHARFDLARGAFGELRLPRAPRPGAWPRPGTAAPAWWCATG